MKEPEHCVNRGDFMNPVMKVGQKKDCTQGKMMGNSNSQKDKHFCGTV